MHIKHKLYMNAGISIVLVVVLLSVVLVTSGRIAEENEKHQLLMDVYKSVSELDIVAYDYVLHREKRMKHQWNIKHDSLGEILDGVAEEEGLKSIRADYAILGDLFSQVTANNEKIQKLTQEGASQGEIDTAIALEERLVAQLLIISHSVFTDASRLAEEALAEVTAAQRLAASSTLILMIILAVTVTTSSLLVARSISKPLGELTKGAEIIGRGDLEHKVGVTSKDELGQLAAAFNQMTASLREITASRDELDREIAERKRVEEALRKMALFAELNPAPVLRFDNGGRVVSVNPAGVAILENEAEKDVLLVSLLPSMADIDLGQCVRDGLTIVHEATVGQQNFQFVIRGVPELGIGHIYGADITVRKQAEEQLLKSNTELTAVNDELEAFSYSVSHDLRAPLRSIDGFSQVLLEDYPDKLDEQGKHYLNRVRAASQHMGQLIDDLLNLSRLTRGDLNREVVDLTTLAQAIAETLKETQAERQVEFVIHKGLVTNGDTRLLRALLENLLDNAWKFTSKHPSARIEFGISQVESKETFFVRDDGIGFDMRYADKLFGAFQRLHAPSEFPGTGIGLATVKRIINRHGGSIWAEGAVEQGATFYFSL